MDWNSIIDDLIAENEILKNYIKDLEFQIQILQNANDIENKNINGLKNIVDATIERTLR